MTLRAFTLKLSYTSIICKNYIFSYGSENKVPMLARAPAHALQRYDCEYGLKVSQSIYISIFLSYGVIISATVNSTSKLTASTV